MNKEQIEHEKTLRLNQKAFNKLQNIEIRNKNYRLYMEKGLYLQVSPHGGTWWRLKYHFNGKEKRISLGVYPDVSLAQARERRDEARKLLAIEIDPAEHRKQTKIEKIIQSLEEKERKKEQRLFIQSQIDLLQDQIADWRKKLIEIK